MVLKRTESLLFFCGEDYVVESVSVLTVDEVKVEPVESVVDSDVPLTSGGCSFLGGSVSRPLATSEYLYLAPA